MGSWATVGDYYAWKGEVEPELDAAARLKLEAGLERATDRIRPVMRLASYPRDVDGLPASNNQRTALRRAVAAEYEAVEVGSGGDFTGVAPEWDSVGAIGVQFSRRTKPAAAANTGIFADISPEAARILRGATPSFWSTNVSH